MTIPTSHRDLLHAKGFAFVGTVGPSGTPQVSPTWYLWDDATGEVLLSLTTGRQKYRNLARHPAVALSIPDPANPYRYLEIRGRVRSMDRDENRALINALTKKYVDQNEHDLDGPADIRVVVRIVPEKINAFDLADIR